MIEALPNGEVNGIPYTVAVDTDENETEHFTVTFDGEELRFSPTYKTEELEKVLAQQLEDKKNV